MWLPSHLCEIANIAISSPSTRLSLGEPRAPVIYTGRPFVSEDLLLEHGVEVGVAKRRRSSLEVEIPAARHGAAALGQCERRFGAAGNHLGKSLYSRREMMCGDLQATMNGETFLSPFSSLPYLAQPLNGN